MQFLYQGLPQARFGSVSDPCRARARRSEALAARARAGSEALAARARRVRGTCGARARRVRGTCGARARQVRGICRAHGNGRTATLLTALYSTERTPCRPSHLSTRNFCLSAGSMFHFSFFTPRPRRKKRPRQLPLKGSWRGLPEALERRPEETEKKSSVLVVTLLWRAGSAAKTSNSLFLF